MTCINDITVCSQEATMSSLREQIFANATALFPHMQKNSLTYAQTGVFNPQELFQVIISSCGSKYKAILVGGATVAKQVISRGPEAGCVAEALAGLLKVLAEAMGWYTNNLLGELKNAEETESGGEVDLKMVEDGFHFAHVQHWVQNKGIARA